jgi:hypothetical protein
LIFLLKFLLIFYLERFCFLSLVGRRCCQLSSDHLPPSHRASPSSSPLAPPTATCCRSPCLHPTVGCRVAADGDNSPLCGVHVRQTWSLTFAQGPQRLLLPIPTSPPMLPVGGGQLPRAASRACRCDHGEEGEGICLFVCPMMCGHTRCIMWA